jgi:cytochrome P450 family 138
MVLATDQWGDQSVTESSEVAYRLPPAPRWPQVAQDIAYLTRGRRLMHFLYDRIGTAFSMRLPFYGPAVVISDPDLIKELFKQPATAVRGAEPNLGLVLGPGSSFGLQGEKHRRHRKLILPQFHGDRMRAYESLIEAETMEEIAQWREGREFAVQSSMMRITLDTILRGIFGAQGAEFDALRTLMPRMIKLGSKLALVPALHRDFGPWSPWRRMTAMRAELDGIFATLIARAVADPAMDQRSDILSLLLQARYDNGEPMSHSEIGDELFTLVVAGHETTATSLAWAFERLRRHPGVLDRVVEELDAGKSDLLQATVYEVLRTRPIIDAVSRQVIAPALALGPWIIPAGHTITVNIGLVHGNEAVFSDADRFDVDRFAQAGPEMYSWVPFGGGSRRCPGAAFANLEMLVVLRTVLREFRLVPTDARDERITSNGVVSAPGRGGRVVVYRRRRGGAHPPATPPTVRVLDTGLSSNV